MKNALILHGLDGHSQENWFPWLKKELEKKGWKVWVPDLPHSECPNMKLFNQHILSNKDWKFDKYSVIIGHSAGAVAILGLLQVLPKETKIDTCILVGSFKDDLGMEALKNLFNVPLDFEKIKNQAENFVFIHSDNDPYCPLEHAKYLADKVDGKLKVKKGQGHFNTGHSKKYKKSPFLLNILEEK
jgi:predicted alpha/beta hydrolase family esterase